MKPVTQRENVFWALFSISGLLFFATVSRTTWGLPSWINLVFPPIVLVLSVTALVVRFRNSPRA